MQLTVGDDCMETVFKINDAAPDQLETMGTKEKFWFLYKDEKYLFKIGRYGTGENWAEVFSSRLCEVLEIPHAVYNFAIWSGIKGVVTKTFVPQFGRLVHGNELLAKIKPGYDLEKKYKQRDHRLRTVLSIMKGISGLRHPIGSSDFVKGISLEATFVGYIVFDALISNQDRHHQNWSFVLMPGKLVHLSPSYDHASSLGCRISDEERMERLTTKDKRRTVEAYIERSKTPFYSASGDVLSSIESVEYCKRICPDGCEFWKERLTVLSISEIKKIADSIPDDLMSEEAKSFATRMIELNKQRILQV